jgi:hypothetical protein
MQQQGCFELSQRKRRVPKEYLGAFKAGHRHAAREYIDEEFSQGLLLLALAGVTWATHALEYITKFNNEHYRCVFNKKRSDFNPGKKRRKELYKEQNRRYADAMAQGVDREYDIDRAETESEEDALIALIDLKREMEKANKQ